MLTFKFEPNKILLVREDGWQYPLNGIVSLNYEADYGDGGWSLSINRFVQVTHVWTATIYAPTDETLDSIRVLRDELGEGTRLRIESIN